jgi:prepilin-type N-terminal cleavage/methylation domain-containing protein
MKTNLKTSGRQPAGRPDHAFTLTELLVVIATLAILAVVLFPALARSDDHGTRMVCVNNLRQMAMAMNSYAGENRDYFAFPNWDGGSAESPAGWLYLVDSVPGLGSAGTDIPDPYLQAPGYALARNYILAWQSGLWFRYVNNFKAYLCPVDIESPDYLPPSSTGGRQNKLSSYVMNGAVSNYRNLSSSPPGVPCKITDVWNPACYLLWEPDENVAGRGNPGAFEYNDGASYPENSEGIGRLHSANGGNMLCVGGNVQFVTVQTWKAQTVVGAGPGPGGKTLAWWAPGASNGN